MVKWLNILKKPQMIVLKSNFKRAIEKFCYTNICIFFKQAHFCTGYTFKIL